MALTVYKGLGTTPSFFRSHNADRRCCMVQVIIILFLFIGIYCGINAEKTQLSHTEIHKMKKSWSPFHCLSTTLNTTSEEILVI